MNARVEAIDVAFVNPNIQPVSPLRARPRPSRPAVAPEVAAPEPPPVDVIHAEPAEGPKPEDPADLQPPEVRQARGLREKAASMVAQGVPPLVLDAQRGLESASVGEEEDTGESRLRVDAAEPRKRRQRRPN